MKEKTDDAAKAATSEAIVSRMARFGIWSALLLSLAVHVVLAAATSVGLYRSWAEWGVFSEAGFHTPSVIKRLEKDRARAEAKARAEAEAAAKAKAAEASAPQGEGDTPPAKATPAKPEPSSPGTARQEAEKPAALPLDKEVAPRAKTFNLDGIDL